MKFWRVDDPLRRRFESEVSPPVAVRVVPTAREPVKLAAEVMVCPFTRPEVMVFEPRFKAPDEVIAPRVEIPAVRFVVKRLVEDAVLAKVLVDVAKVEVAKVEVRDAMVEEAVMMRPRVVVGARYPLPCTERSRKSEV